MIVKMIFDINKVDTDRGGSTIRLKITRLVEVKIRKAGKNLISLQKKTKKQNIRESTCFIAYLTMLLFLTNDILRDITSWRIAFLIQHKIKLFVQF